MRFASLAFLVLALVAAPARAEILSQDPSFKEIIPADAYKGVGGWASGDYWIATGHSIDMGALGAAKDVRAELRIAEESARHGIILQAAMADHPEVDEESYDLSADIAGFHAVVTYKLEQRAGLFLIGVAKRNEVRVQIVFNPKKARTKAMALFDAKDFKEAAARLSALTSRGVQDDEIIAFAKAASWHVNLDAGVTGDARIEALNGLGRFYSDRGDYESSIRLFYKIYDAGPDGTSPSRELLQTLVNLSRKTHRDETAIKFQAEIDRRWPITQPATAPSSIQGNVSEAHFDEAYAAVIAHDELLLTSGGTAVVRNDGATYFIAVGTTAVNGNSPGESLRQIKEGRAQAQREAIMFVEQETIVVHEIQVESTTLVRMSVHTTAHSSRVRDSALKTKVQGIMKGLRPAGSWKSPDGTVFFYALAIKIE